MTSSQKLWLTISTISLCATLVFVVGLGFAVRSIVFPASAAASDQFQSFEPSPVDEREGVTIVTIGDSLTRGFGDDSGRGGYAGIVKERLEQTADKPVYLIPFAVDGYRSDQLMNDLTEEKGIVAAIERADFIFMSIGANDFIQFGEELSLELVNEQKPFTLERIDRIFTRLTELNEEARIVYIGLYDPFSALDPAGEAALLIQQFNHDVFQLTIQHPQVTVVPTFDLFYRMSDRFLSSDLFHPSEAGYARIAERVMQVIEAVRVRGEAA